MKNRLMQRTAIHVAVASALAALALSSQPALADVTSDLKAEIAAQRAQIEAQRLRLEAMEKKLDAVTQQAATAAATQQAAAKDATQQVAAAAPVQAPAPAKSWVPTLVASAEWQPGFTFQVTPVDTVTLYGLIDATLSDISNSNAKGDHKTGFQTAWMSGNRWGITGRHGIYDNTSGVIFKLESEFDYQTGEEDTPGVLFNRDAWVGFQSDTIGKLTFGRQNALARDFSGIYGDPYTGARVTLEEGGYTNVNNYKQLIFYAASAAGTRVDRGIVWKKEFGPFVAGLMYAFPANNAGDAQKGSSSTAAFGFNGANDAFHLAGYYNHFNVSDLVYKQYSIGGNVQFGPLVRLNAGYYKQDSEQGGNVGNRKDHAWTVSSKFTPNGPFDYELGYQVLTAKNAGVNGSGFVLTPYADASGVKSTANGDKDTLYGSVFYHFDRRAEVYLVADYMKLKDGYKLAVTNGHDNQVEVGVGLRMRF
ncbi:MAG: porin [Usitatibacter sp.]